MIRIAIIEDDDDMMRIVSKCVKESSMGVADLDICCLTNAEDFLDKACLLYTSQSLACQPWQSASEWVRIWCSLWQLLPLAD